MNDDNLFRWVLIGGFLSLFPIGIYFRIRSQQTREKLDRRQEGLFVLFTLRPIALAMQIAVVIFMINPTWMAWSSIQLPVELRWFGAAVGLFGIGFLVWTFQTLGTNLTDTVVTRREHTLVTGGPYGYVRHPFYICGLLIVISGALITANWFIGLCGVTVILLLVLRTRIEEDKLIERFGDEYRQYMVRTGRFFPRFGRRM